MEHASPSARVVPQRVGGAARVGIPAAYWLIRILCRTLRHRVEDYSRATDGVTPVIFAIWHNRLAMAGPSCIRIFRKEPTRRIAALISASRDGGFLSGVLERFQIQPVRGSSSRRGRQAFLELTRWAEKGYDIAITPDGPRGPMYEVQEGVIALAQVTGLKIIPVGLNYSRKWRIKSWDRFQVPIPFSRCHTIYGTPIVVPRELTEAERLEYRQSLRMALMNLTVD